VFGCLAACLSPMPSQIAFYNNNFRLSIRNILPFVLRLTFEMLLPGRSVYSLIVHCRSSFQCVSNNSEEHLWLPPFHNLATANLRHCKLNPELKLCWLVMKQLARLTLYSRPDRYPFISYEKIWRVCAGLSTFALASACCLPLLVPENKKKLHACRVTPFSTTLMKPR